MTTTPLISSPRPPRRLLWGLALCLTALMLAQICQAFNCLYAACLVRNEVPFQHDVFELSMYIYMFVSFALSFVGYWLFATPLTPAPRTRWANLILWYLRLQAPVLLAWNGLLAVVGLYFFNHQSDFPALPVTTFLSLFMFLGYISIIASILTIGACTWRFTDLVRTLPALKPHPHLWCLRYLPLICAIAVPLLRRLPELTGNLYLPGQEFPLGYYLNYYFPHYRTCLEALTYLGDFTLILLFALFYRRLGHLRAQQPSKSEPHP
jgi:hypothetical protein